MSKDKGAEIQQRKKIVSYIHDQLVGPMDGSDELINDKPHKRYLMGILFPKQVTEDEVDESTPDEIDNTVALASEFKPSSMALSFAVSQGASLKIIVRAGLYSKSGSKWQREAVDDTITYCCQDKTPEPVSVFGGRGKVSIKKRPWRDGHILTVALYNDVSSGARLQPADCLYQSRIHCQLDRGRFTEYPGTDRFRFDEEQEELSLLYSNRINWSVGHGCGSVWEEDFEESPAWIGTSCIPQKEVFGFSTKIDFTKYPDVPSDTLSLQKIANPEIATEKELTEGLRLFVAAYKSWISEIKAHSVAEQHQSAKKRIVSRLNEASERMLRGIDALENSRNGMRAFRLANKAMLMQMIHSGKEYGGTAKSRDQFVFSEPDYLGKGFEDYNWRPFQLAFQLLVIESLIYDEAGDYSENRDIVDLLWFPTGGGKTEAYLAVAAWEMFYRRLEDGLRGAGTAVIKRYTLRLLTSQQFQRAGTLICAMESMRKGLTQEMGREPFTLGLWVGQGSAPNKFTSGDRDNPAALELYQNLLEEDVPENPFQLQRCPWCGTSIVPSERTEDTADYGIHAAVDNFHFFCPTSSCTYHDKLPIQIVDEALYQQPPSLLIGTVDKFARLVWEERTSAFFGGDKFNPPSLIIQDELHLISGPLGTIAGIYEAGIDTLIRRLGGRAKVIAATATIRSARQQNRCLFGREVRVFPPPGIDEKDSFFSREDKGKNSPGRLYLGIMPSGHTGQTALVQTAAALLQAPIATDQKGDGLDTWWTLPVYHNSRRELGKTMTLSRDDIPSRIGVIASQGSERECIHVEELSANVKGARIPEVLDKLQVPACEEGTIDILPCTNMISVGVDISRLGIMLINGQPKTTAEYIQASSRVGRDKERPPAIVVTLFSPSKPRDRSHYETFSSYHQSLYRHVEPTSITPWAKPARERALHAALITMVRLTDHLRANDMAGNFDRDDAEFQAMLVEFKERICEAASDKDKKEIQDVMEHIDELVLEWHKLAQDGMVNRYTSKSTQFNPLITSFDPSKKSNAWRTLNSMRNVDTETAIWVRGED